MSNLATLSKNSVNHLGSLWPKGVVAPARWLVAQGYSQEQLTYYAREGWLDRAGRGAYTHPKSQPRHWIQVLYTLQHLLALPVHVGGQTLLDDEGFGPNVQDKGLGRVVLYGSGAPPPLWLTQLKGFNFEYRALDLSRPRKRAHTKPAAKKENTKVAGPWISRQFEDLEVEVSSLELAFLELLYDVPKRVSFDLARQYAEPLSVMRPSVLQALLESCTVAKVNRLALYFGSAFKLPWFKGLEPGRIFVGQGQRQLAKGGRLDPFTRITVPQNFPVSAALLGAGDA